jgi:two-component system, chemotaxis family, chemotaxis protein CheY
MLESSNSPTVMLVGHCGPDSYSLRNAVGRAIAGVTIISADDGETLEANLARADLLLVNRVLLGYFESESGMDLIARLARTPGAPRTMLISNFPEAQAAAEAAGALPGFGKKDIYAEETTRRLRAAVSSTQAT